MTEAEGPRQPAISVLLADDHPVVWQGLAALLGTLPGVTVVAQAGNGEEAIREVGLNRPDVVVRTCGCRRSTASKQPGGSSGTTRARRSWC